jgi:cytoskeletal protein RodZ
MKSLVTLVVAVVITSFVVAYFYYHSANRTVTSGEIHHNNPPSDSDAAQASSSTQPDAAAPNGSPTSLQPAGQPQYSTQPTAQTVSQPMQTTAQSEFSVPPGDSQDRNAAEGMRFSASGRYEVYRQGDLTYRVNTLTGRACVLFATDAEWRKPRVFRNGCNGKS